jgi:hypothetical protein
MKIIGGKKDYYDYLVSHYGYDEHIVYDRRNTNPISYKHDTRFVFHICGVTVPVFQISESKFTFKHSEVPKNYIDQLWFAKYHNKSTNLNAKLRQPVLCEASIGTKEPFIPCLKDFGFASYLPAHEMYCIIYAFLGWLKDNPAPANNQTDKDKIVALGFDLKSSFRPNLKT